MADSTTWQQRADGLASDWAQLAVDAREIAAVADSPALRDEWTARSESYQRIAADLADASDEDSFRRVEAAMAEVMTYPGVAS